MADSLPRSGARRRPEASFAVRGGAQVLAKTDASSQAGKRTRELGSGICHEFERTGACSKEGCKYRHTRNVRSNTAEAQTKPTGRLPPQRNPATVRTDKKKMVCFNCGLEGHKKAECPRRSEKNTRAVHDWAAAASDEVLDVCLSA